MNTPVSVATAETPRFFSLSQRIGRLRYFVYMLAYMVIGCPLFLIAVYLFALLLPHSAGKLLASVAFIMVKNFVIPIIVFVLTMRRVRDFNLSAWWAFTILVPFVTLIYLFVPGTKGDNRFGPQPSPNHPGLRFTAFALPIALLGFYYGLHGGKGDVDLTSRESLPGIRSSSSGSGLKAY